MVKGAIHQEEERVFTYSLFYIISVGVLGLLMTPWLFGIIILLLVPGLVNTKIIVGDKSLRIQKGFFIKSTEDISYKKINNVVCETSFGSDTGTIKIYTGNDKPFQHRLIHNVRDLKNIIHDKMGE